MFIGGLLPGCATHKQAEEIQRDVQTLRTENAATQRLLARMDSIVAAGAEADSRLRGEMSTTVDELGRQIAILLENYNTMMAKLDELSRKPAEIRILESSSGSQDSPTTGGGESTPAINCDSTYDEAFILVRQLEYEKAITGFRTFLEHCDQHNNIPNAHYWIGESLYMMDKFADAITAFELLANEHKSSPNIDRALYKLARSHEELGQKDQAKTVYQQLVEDFPGTLSAEQAADRLREL
jgi:tol-pal system protein YbgF